MLDLRLVPPAGAAGDVRTFDAARRRGRGAQRGSRVGARAGDVAGPGRRRRRGLAGERLVRRRRRAACSAAYRFRRRLARAAAGGATDRRARGDRRRGGGRAGRPRTPRRPPGPATWRTRPRREDAGLAGRAGRARTEPGSAWTSTVREPGWLAEHGFGGVLAVGAGSAAPPRLDRGVVAPAACPRRRARRPRRQGHHVRHRRAEPQAGRGHADDVHRHGRRRRRARARCARSRGRRCRSAVTAPRAGRRERVRPAARAGPGDVIRHFGGRTSEISNTDAEGRLVLADALAYAVARLRPDRARRHRDADRRDEGGARPAHRRLVRDDGRPRPPLLSAAGTRDR